jgi:hypothetical protein
MRLTAFLSSIVAGFVIWAISRQITGHIEPWDSDSIYFSGSMAFFSLCLGIAFPRSVISITIGLIFGQSAYMLIALPTGPLWPVGLLTLIIYSGILALPISWLGSRIRRLIQSKTIKTP